MHNPELSRDKAKKKQTVEINEQNNTQNYTCQAHRVFKTACSAQDRRPTKQSIRMWDILTFHNLLTINKHPEIFAGVSYWIKITLMTQLTHATTLLADTGSLLSSLVISSLTTLQKDRNTSSISLTLQYVDNRDFFKKKQTKCQATCITGYQVRCCTINVIDLRPPCQSR